MDTSIVEDADIISNAVRLILEGHDSEAALALGTLTLGDPVPTPRFTSVTENKYFGSTLIEPLTTLMRVQIYERDGWRCRYCTRKLIVAGVLEILTSLCPGFKGLLPGHHMPFDRTEHAVERVYPNVDHVHAVSRGGAWLDPNNHVTACTPCNAKKSDKSGWNPGSIVKDDWDGLVSSYRPLANRLDHIRPYHRWWFRALDV